MSESNGDRSYENSALACERQFCGRVVNRSYQPFCDRCFRNRQSNSFKSRDGLQYEYDGRRWVRIEKEVKEKRDIEAC